LRGTAGRRRDGASRALHAGSGEGGRVAARATPELQPPLAEGVPYQSFPGALSECTVGTTHVTGGGVVIEIKYALEKQANSRWSDRLVIMNVDGGAAIDDILFASFPTDTYRSGLRRVLFDSFDI
jgi:hypothetical protein